MTGAMQINASSLAALPGVTHAFFSREGGVSTGLYAGLNCGLGSNDDPAAVAENRKRAMAALGLPATALATLYQVHSPRVVTVEAKADEVTGRKIEADALVTKAPGVALGVLTADCAPVLLADAKAGIVAAAHAGWRGTFDGVIDATVARMVQLGALPGRITAAIGPCIAQDSYEVGPEFVARFVGALPRNRRYFGAAAKAGHSRFDLPAFVADRLAVVGVGRIERLGIDSYADEARCYSFRRATHRGEADYGRNLAAIALAARS